MRSSRRAPLRPPCAHSLLCWRRPRGRDPSGAGRAGRQGEAPGAGGGALRLPAPNRCLPPSIQPDSGRIGRWRASWDRAKESEASPITELRSWVLPRPHTSRVGAPHQSSVPGILTTTFVFTHQHTLSRVQGTAPRCLTHLPTGMLWRQCLDWL